MISSEAFFPSSNNKHTQNVKIAFYSLKIIHRLPMNLHAIMSSPWQYTGVVYALLATFSYLVSKHVTCFNRFVISRNTSSTSDTTDGGADDLHSEDANTPSTNSQKPNGRTHINIQRII